MAARNWNKDTASKRIDSRIAEFPLNDIEIKEFVRHTDLTNSPVTWPAELTVFTCTRIF
jgi:hypothetical protein